ncbi:hypothetical protein [Streptomyces sp. NBC_00826]|uniref:hypothetical protein n=1 Tax=Streptomyces sp. NBC_00826 TaxID=2975845 RepID=UPI002F914AC0|nr:hypothetical protein OG832_44420 [Streptomyces sp. NBC_00826]WTB60648.1 hypothetical protein OG832_47485 [Streptomyces sp. NBC_00826]
MTDTFEHTPKIWNAAQLGVPVRTLSPILLAYSVPGGAGGSLVGTAAAVLAFRSRVGCGNVYATEAVAEGA